MTDPRRPLEPWEVESIDDTPLPDRRRYLDMHVHSWPRRVYAAITDWFDRLGWRIHQRVWGEELDRFLEDRGITRYAALVYAHKPGMAPELNRWLADYSAAHPRAIPFGTVHPDDDVRSVLAEAFDSLGLAGLKLHAHVMGIGPEDARLLPVYEILCERDLPLVFHAGTEPASDAYPRPCEEVSGLARLRRVLERFPTLRCVIPHLGAAELDLAEELLDSYPNVRLDSAMVLARYFPERPARDWVLRNSGKIFYGTDFPILPYDYDRERRCILGMGLGPEAEEAIFWRNAAEFLGLEHDSQ